MGNIFHPENTRHCARKNIWILAILSSALCSPVTNASQKLEDLAKRVGVRILAEATSDREILDESKAQLPYGRMSARSRQRTSHILGNLSQYRRMPCLQFEVNPGIYQYLINHPDVAISTWRVMGISKLNMFQTGEFEYEASAADGSKGIADVLWRDANQCIFIVKGSYSSPLLPGAIEASALVWLRYRFVDAGDGKFLVNQQVETFISFPSHAVDTLARLATMVTNTILDRNVFEVSLYARMMSTAAKKEPEWIEQLAARMDGVLPQRRSELVLVAHGQNPHASKMLATAVASERAGAVNLKHSGSFQAFETSLHQVNAHVPLVASEVQHKPSYGRSIGQSNPQMAKPHKYMPAAAQKALAEKRERKLRTQQYNQFYANPEAKGVPHVGTPVGVPPSEDVSGSGKGDALTAELPSLPISAFSLQRAAAGKASSGAMPVAPSTPLTTTGRTRSGRTTSGGNLHAKTVSAAQPQTTASAGSKSARRRKVAAPPVPTADSGVK